MAEQELEIWANQLTKDALTDTFQRREIFPEEFKDGWLRTESISAQQLNQLFYLLSVYSNASTNAPILYPTSVSIPITSLEMNGQIIAEVNYPNAFALYGTNLPDLATGAPAGFTYIIRKS